MLSRQASQLEGLGIVAVRKGYIGKRPRTWFSLTPKGRKLWKSHLAALRAIAEDSVLAASGTVPERPGPNSRGDSAKRADWVA